MSVLHIVVALHCVHIALHQAEAPNFKRQVLQVIHIGITSGTSSQLVVLWSNESCVKNSELPKIKWNIKIQSFIGGGKKTASVKTTHNCEVTSYFWHPPVGVWWDASAQVVFTVWHKQTELSAYWWSWTDASPLRSTFTIRALEQKTAWAPTSPDLLLCQTHRKPSRRWKCIMKERASVEEEMEMLLRADMSSGFSCIP